MHPSRCSSVLSKLRLAAAHAKELEAALQVMPAELADRFTALRANLQSADADLRAMRDELAGPSMPPPAVVPHGRLVFAVIPGGAA